MEIEGIEARLAELEREVSGQSIQNRAAVLTLVELQRPTGSGKAKEQLSAPPRQLTEPEQRVAEDAGEP